MSSHLGHHTFIKPTFTSTTVPFGESDTVGNLEKCHRKLLAANFVIVTNNGLLTVSDITVTEGDRNSN